MQNISFGKIILITVLPIVIAISAFGQNVPKGAIPEDLHETFLIIEKLDSIGPKCKVGKKYVYCNENERNIDKQLSSLQKLQELSFQKYKYPHVMVLPKAFPYQEFIDYKDVSKYKYILKMHRLPGTEEDPEVKWVYYFYDRKSKKEYPRIQQISDYKFKSLKHLIALLNEN